MQGGELHADEGDLVGAAGIDGEVVAVLGGGGLDVGEAVEGVEGAEVERVVAAGAGGEVGDRVGTVALVEDEAVVAIAAGQRVVARTGEEIVRARAASNTSSSPTP